MSAKTEAGKVQYPLRERRKQRTRAALIDAAYGLFATKGYDDTTLEQVADEAGLHVQTLYRHFPSKPDLAIAVDRNQIEDFRVAIDDPQRTGTTFEFWREAIIRNVAGLEAQSRGLEHYRELVRPTDRSPSVALRLHTIRDEYEDLLTASLAMDFAMDPERERLPRLVACMLVGGNRDVARRYAETGDFDLAEECLAVADSVALMFEQYIVDTKRRSPAQSNAAGG